MDKKGTMKEIGKAVVVGAVLLLGIGLWLWLVSVADPRIWR